MTIGSHEEIEYFRVEEEITITREALLTFGASDLLRPGRHERDYAFAVQKVIGEGGVETVVYQPMDVQLIR